MENGPQSESNELSEKQLAGSALDKNLRSVLTLF